MTTRAVLVTGASKGIGEAVARRLAEAGMRVFAGYRAREDAAPLADLGAVPVRFDVTDLASVWAARETVEAEVGEGGLLGLVNNAGVPGAGPVELTPPEEFRRVFEVNFFGVLHVTQAFLPLLRVARGRIVMISSLSGVVSMPFLAPYTASKFALEALSDSLRREVLPEGMEVVVIEPGPIATPIWDNVDALDIEPYLGTPYETRLRGLRDAALASGRAGLPPDTVAREVERALTRRRPRSRVVVTAPSGKLKARVVRWLPERLADRLIVGRRP